MNGNSTNVFSLVVRMPQSSQGMCVVVWAIHHRARAVGIVGEVIAPIHIKMVPVSTVNPL